MYREREMCRALRVVASLQLRRSCAVVMFCLTLVYIIIVQGLPSFQQPAFQ